MRLAVTPETARRSEREAVRAGATLRSLMERAGSAVAAEACSLVPQGPIVVFAGGGNNGGDGWECARVLSAGGRAVRVLSLADPSTLPSPAAEVASAAIAVGVEWGQVSSPAESVLGMVDAALIVDALLGIGAIGAPRGAYADTIIAIGDSDAAVIAVDVPSGVDAATGATPGASVRADVTVTFGAMKAGLLLYPGAECAGDIVIADIGLPEPDESPGGLEVWDWSDLAALVPVPGPADHKGTRGRVLVVGGIPGMTGAACLASSAALRSGAGYVTVAVPEPSLAVVEIKLTAPVKVALQVEPDGGIGASAIERLSVLSRRADSVVLGPGLGRAESTVRSVRDWVATAGPPLVLDADGLWAIGPDLSLVRGRAVVVTPHAGEAARMLGISREAVEADRPSAARAIGGDGVICVLKGAHTLVSDGERVVVTMSGGPELATLGTGDVLSGIIGALLAQGLDPIEAAVLGAHLHGASGDEAADELTTVCCTAEDVITYLPRAVRELVG